MKLADAFQVAEIKRSAPDLPGYVRNPQPPAKMPTSALQSSPRTGETHIQWSDAEWLTVTRELMRLFPEIGLPAAAAVGDVRLKHMKAAMQALPIQRRRQLVHLTTVRPRLTQYCARIVEESKRVQPTRPAIGPLPSSVVYRQPDGAQNGLPSTGARVFWREPEWYSLAVELAYTDPSFLETLNHLQPADLFRAQRVLPTNRRRHQTSFNSAKIRAELAPAMRRVRAAIDAKRNEEANNSLAAQAEEALRAEKARQAAENAAQAALLDQLAQSPEFIAKALGAAEFGSLIGALLTRGAASLQAVLEVALVNAFSSPAVKQAMVVNLHIDRAEGSAQAFKANPPSATANAPANVICKPLIGILGALPQQGQVIAAAYPQLRIKAIDKNLTGTTLRDAVLNCDRLISMTSFISHSMDGIASKALGDKYTRVDGGVSSVRRQIDAWLATGAIQAATVAANEQPNEAKGE
jgi:hypothetical protein